MADLRNRFTNSESMKNISNIRTPMTPDNKYRRIGLLIVGITLIIAGIIVWVVSCSSNAQYALNSETTIETSAEPSK
ncbi:MAG: hypothetical protein E7233_06700 [Lachnospiraceae bacterium]|nr:hypothetical protein [Lachnospiraceae bacterium]